MKKIFSPVLLSILFHAFILIHIDKKEIKKEEKVQDRKIKVKLIKKKYKEIKPKTKLKNLDYFSLFQTDSLKFNSKKFLVAKNGEIPVTRQLTIFSLLSNYINYPDVLAKHKIQGGVTASFILSKNGVYIEKLTNIDSKSAYLRVYVAKRLRKAFSEINLSQLKLTKTVKIKLLVMFHLTQENNPLLKSGLYDDYIFLYRKQAGISTISDRVNFTIKKAFGYISNILTLINDLVPDSAKTKVKRIYELQSYENDPFW